MKMEGMRAVVLGGKGFIGRALVRQLLDGGAQVRVVSRSASRGSAGNGYEEAPGDVARPESLPPVMDGADVVFQLTMGGGPEWSHFERDIVQGAGNVARACLQANVRRLVYASSIAALYLGGTASVTESDGPDPQSDRRSHYARAKAASERELLRMHQSEGLRVVICRPGVVVGPGGMLNHSGLGYWPSDLDCIGWGRGDYPLPLVLAGDVADAMARAGCVDGIDGMTFNLAGGVALTAREYVEEMAARSLRRVRFHPQSLWKMQAIDIGKWVLKAIARKPENPFPSYRDLKTRRLSAPLDCRLAMERLGWRPNTDRALLLREAIDSHLPAIHPGDLRLERA